MVVYLNNVWKSHTTLVGEGVGGGGCILQRIHENIKDTHARSHHMGSTIYIKNSVYFLPVHSVQIKILIIRHGFTSLFLWLLILLLACYKNMQNVLLIMQYNRIFYVMDVFEKDVKIFGSTLLLISAWNADSNNCNTLEIN